MDIIYFKPSPSLLFKQGMWPAQKGRVESRKEKPKPNHVAEERWHKPSTIEPSAATLWSPPPCSRSVPYASPFPLRSPSAPNSHHIHKSQMTRLPNAQLADSTFSTAGPSVHLIPGTAAWPSLSLWHSGPSQSLGGSHSEKSSTSHLAVTVG